MASSPALNAGDLVLLPFPYTDLSASKQRPALILVPPDRVGDLVAIAITSQPGHSNTVSLTTSDLARGVMPKDSWVRADKIVTLHSGLIRKTLGTVKPALLTAVRDILCPTLGCK